MISAETSQALKDAEEGKKESEERVLIAQAELETQTALGVANAKEQEAIRLEHAVEFVEQMSIAASDMNKADMDQKVFGQSLLMTVGKEEQILVADKVVQGNQRMKKHLTDNKPKIEELLGIDRESMRDAAVLLRTIQIARILFLCVISGCELDLDGFALACTTYWHAGESTDPGTNSIMRGLLCIGPGGYLLAVALYILDSSFGVGAKCWAWMAQQSMNLIGEKKRKKGKAQPLLEEEVEGVPEDVEEQLQRKAGPMLSHGNLPLRYKKESIHIKLYHFLPILRYFLLVKDAEPSDIEALFRVNALSTFTLGFAQVFCMFLGFGNGSLHWEVKTITGVVAQVVNASMTYLYFFTKYADRMKRSMAVESYQYNKSLITASEFERYTMASQLLSLRYGKSDPTNMRPEDMDPQQLKLWEEKEHYRQKCIRDMDEMAQVSVADALHMYSTDQLFRWRRLMIEKQVASYCDDRLDTGGSWRTTVCGSLLCVIVLSCSIMARRHLWFT